MTEKATSPPHTTPKLRLHMSSLTAARLNPQGLSTFIMLSLRPRLYVADHLALRDNFAGAGIIGSISPALTTAGFLVEVQPLSVLRLWATFELVRHHGLFNLMQSFPHAQADYSDTALKRLGDLPDSDPLKNYPTTGSRLTLGSDFQIKVGPIALRNFLQVSWADHDLRAGDRVFYDVVYDLLAPDGGWVLNGDLDLLYIGALSDGAAIIAGTRWTFARSFLSDVHSMSGENSVASSDMMTHRLGPLVAYRFFTKPEGTSQFNKPTVIVVANWWLRHRYRTGDDVSQSIPYFVVAFSFMSDLLPHPAL